MKTQESRRYQRVHFRRDFGANDRLVKAKVFWKNLESADVFDLSYGGMAASKPGLLELKNGETIDLTLELGDLPAFDLKAKVAWIKDYSVGLSFLELGPEGHLALRRFLSDKLVGASLVLVQPESYPKESDFDFWFSGPRGTHLFVKFGPTDSYPQPIESMEVDLDGDRMLVRGEEIISGASLLDSTVQILSHAPEHYVELYQVLEQLTKLKVRQRE